MALDRFGFRFIFFGGFDVVALGLVVRVILVEPLTTALACLCID